MPWLTGTAFLHSVMMQEKRGMMKNWNVWLIFSTFMLTILGTLLTRSGIVSSVHAFAQSPIGAWFYTFIIIVFAGLPLHLLHAARPPQVGEQTGVAGQPRVQLPVQQHDPARRLLHRTLGHALSSCSPSTSHGSKVTVGAPFYNRVNIPIGLFLLFLTGIGPLLAWRSTTLRSIRRNFVLPAIAMAATAIVLMIAGVRPWNDGDDMAVHLLLAHRLHPGRGRHYRHRRGVPARRHRWSAPRPARICSSSMLLLTRRNTRRYGGYIIHFGIVVMFIGIAGGAFNHAAEMEMSYGDTLAIGPYRLVCQSITQDSKPEYDTDYALLDVYRGGKYVTQLAPEKRTYFAGTDHQQASTIVALHSRADADLYSVFEGRNPDSGRPIIKVFLNPLIAWIWIGVAIVVAGTFIALVPNLVRTPVRQRLGDSLALPPAAPLGATHVVARVPHA